MPAVVGFMAGLVDGIDVASAGELQGGAGRRRRPGRGQFCRAGQARSSCARRWPPACWSTSSRARAAGAGAGLAGPRAAGARVAVRVNPDFELKGSGMKMGGGPKQFGIDVEADGAAAGRRSAGSGWTSRASTSSPARRTCAPSRSARRSSSPTNWRCAWRRTRRRRCASSTWAAASAFRTSPANSGSTWRRSATTWRRIVRTRAREMPQAELVIELGRYSSARPASTSRAWSTARSRAGRCSWSPTAG
jgi:hypothetical protein